jgi:hypothetical protein
LVEAKPPTLPSPELSHEREGSQELRLMPVILSTWEVERSGGLWFKTNPNSSQDPISKITQAKWAGGVAQAIGGTEALGASHLIK